MAIIYPTSMVACWISWTDWQESYASASLPVWWFVSVGVATCTHTCPAFVIIKAAWEKRDMSSLACRVYWCSLVFSLQLIIFSTYWSLLLFRTLRLFLWPPHSKGTFNKHHRAGLPTLCSQNHFPWTNSVWHCAQAQEKSYERFAQLPSVLLDWSILSSMLPLFSSSLIQLSFAAKFFWVDWMLVNGLFVAVSALSAFFMEHGCYSQYPAWQGEPSRDGVEIMRLVFITLFRGTFVMFINKRL